MSEPADLGANLKNCPSLINYAPSSNTYSPAQRCVQTTEDRSEPTLKWHCEAETGISVKYMKMSVGGHTQPRAAMKTQPRAATVPISKQLKALSAFHIPYFAKVPVWFIRYVGVCRGFCRYRNCSSFNIELKKKKKSTFKGSSSYPFWWNCSEETKWRIFYRQIFIVCSLWLATYKTLHYLKWMWQFYFYSCQGRSISISRTT